MRSTVSMASPPQIHFDDARVGADLVQCPFGQHRAFVEARDLDAELAHESHVVLDNDDGMIAGDIPKKVRRRDRFRVGHSGDGFVDQQQLRVLREGP